MRSPPAAILIDLDDTIISSSSPSKRIWLKIAEEFRAELAPWDVAMVAGGIGKRSHEFWSCPTRQKQWRFNLPGARRLIVAGVLAEIAPTITVGDAIADRFSAIREEEMCVFPGAHAALRGLRERGIRLALISNGPSESQRAKLSRFDLAQYFDHIQIEGEHGFGKPEDRAYTHALQCLGVPVTKAWMVGDNLEWEVAAPQRLGIFSIWVDSYATGLPVDSPARPDRIIQSLTELIEMVSP